MSWACSVTKSWNASLSSKLSWFTWLRICSNTSTFFTRFSSFSTQSFCRENWEHLVRGCLLPRATQKQNGHWTLGGRLPGCQSVLTCSDGVELLTLHHRQNFVKRPQVLFELTNKSSTKCGMTLQPSVSKGDLCSVHFLVFLGCLFLFSSKGKKMWLDIGDAASPTEIISPAVLSASTSAWGPTAHGGIMTQLDCTHSGSWSSLLQHHKANSVCHETHSSASDLVKLIN